MKGLWILSCFLIVIAVLFAYEDQQFRRSNNFIVYHKSRSQSWGNVELNMPLPYRPGSVPEATRIESTKYLRLPTWSHGYVPCDSRDSEVSCLEVSEAAATLRKWAEESFEEMVIVDAEKEKFEDKLSMLVIGLGIAMATNKGLATRRSDYAGFDLPASVKEADMSMEATVLENDVRFPCLNLSAGRKTLKIQGKLFPQMLYLHGTVSTWIKERFGVHAAYFLGNWLFGSLEKPQCMVGPEEDTVEAFVFDGNQPLITPDEYSNYISRCGVNTEHAQFVTNSDIAGIHNYHTVIDRRKNNICALTTLVSSRRIIRTFGSVFGFWANALQGTSGGFVNSYDKVCVNMSNSQQGSLWHTSCPDGLWDQVYVNNHWLYPCHTNLTEMRFFVDYLLW